MSQPGPALHRLRRAVERDLRDVPGLVLVACSGGPDSLALAAAVALTGRRAGAVVVDHGLQEGSGDVARRAGEQCRTMGLDPVSVRRVDVIGGGGPEAAARSARLAALAQEAEATGASAVLLAHTRDDQAETVLLGLARGSGTRSLAGMPAVRGLWRRPLLGIARSDVHAALAETGLTAWHDPHNLDPAFLRSRVRHEALAVLTEVLGPGVVAALARTAQLARQDADALDEEAFHVGVGLAERGWPVAEMGELSPAVRSRVLRDAALSAGAPAGALTAEHVTEVDRLVTDWHGQGPLTLPGRVNVMRRCGTLYFTRDGTGIGAADGA